LCFCRDCNAGERAENSSALPGDPLPDKEAGYDQLRRWRFWCKIALRFPQSRIGKPMGSRSMFKVALSGALRRAPIDLPHVPCELPAPALMNNVQKEAALVGRPKSGRKRPRRAAAPHGYTRCCSALFSCALSKWKRAGSNGAMRSRLEPVTTDLLTQKGPALGRALENQL